MDRPGRPLLVVVSGLPGTGKSALAETLAARLRMVHVAYEVAGSVAAANLALGSDVCVDAVNDSEAARQTWRRAAALGDATLTFLVTTCSDAAEHRRRLEARTRPFSLVREPTWSQVQQRAPRYAPWTDPHRVLDTQQPPEEVLATAVRMLAEPRGVT